MVEYFAVIFGLLAAIFWGISNTLLKKAISDRSSPVIAAFIYSMVGSLILWSIIFFTYIFDKGEYITNFSGRSIIIFIIAGVVGTGFGRLCSYIAVKKVGISIQSSFISFNPVIATLIAWIFIFEKPTKLQFIGLIMSVIGLVIISKSKGGNKEGWKYTSLVYSILSTFMYGTASVIRRYGFNTTDLNPIQAVSINEVTALTIVFIYILVRNDFDIQSELNKCKHQYLVLAGFINMLGITSLYLSLNYGPVIIATTTSSLSTIVTIIFTYIFLNDIEIITKKQVIGTIIILIGVILIVI